jgi:glycosyltransferase involved in cell wall biosynthesis
MIDSRRVAVVYGAPAGEGGLGLQAASALQALALDGAEVHAFGPGRAAEWPWPAPLPQVIWHEPPPSVVARGSRYPWARWRSGQLQFHRDSALGGWAAKEVKNLHPELCYVFTQVGLETMQWASANRVPTVLDNPNGHIRNFRAICVQESLRWCAAKYYGHPTESMVQRVEREYELADRVRVSSHWAKNSMAAHGVADEKIYAFGQPLNLLRFRPCDDARAPEGPLHVCFVGSLDLRKGFVYLLRAMKLLGPRFVKLEIVGATGDRWCRKLFESERTGLDMECAPGDPLPAYHRAELLVLPSLEDGFGFVVGEAMACGLPVIVTDCCGASEWVRPDESGWVIRAGQAEALASALDHAMRRRGELRSMGRFAREDVERRANHQCLPAVSSWVYGGISGLRLS